MIYDFLKGTKKLFFFLSHHHQIGFQKGINVSVHYTVHIAGFLSGTHVFYKFIRLHHIIADLRTPFNSHFPGFDIGTLGLLLF
jgi:hypothetical protein